MKTRVSRSEVYSCCHSLSLEFSLCRWACLEVNQAAADLLISQPGVFKQLRDSYTSLDDYSTWIKPPPSSPTGYSLELQPACLSASPWPEPPPAAHLSSLDLSKLSSLHVSPSGSQSQESPLSPDRTTPPSSYFPPSTDCKSPAQFRFLVFPLELDLTPICPQISCTGSLYERTQLRSSCRSLRSVRAY
ncbi:uncharacterized protein [Nothobranchius furzeri]|uniref:uncharacterized protein isoform X2 n=1 Tax=Nothobranchius furzeri TaxID=105023 RepID=UPI0039047DD0